MNTSNLTPASDYAHWVEHDTPGRALWSPGNPGSVAKRIVIADDTLSADTAYRLISQGTTLLWRGDFQNGKQLLQALARRIDKKNDPAKLRKRQTVQDATITTEPAAVFNRYRQQQSQRSGLLNRLLIELDNSYGISLRRAPDVGQACLTALGTSTEPTLLSLRALQGLIGAHEWRKKGIVITGLPAPLHVHYGVFSPNRGEYLDLVATAPLPTTDLAFDIGTGSGVLAAILAQRGIRQLIATDLDPKALACAAENIKSMGLENAIQLKQINLFPEGKSALIVCNPPWLPARPTTSLEHAIYDPDSQMLLGFLNGVSEHLLPDGEAWLIMSDLAERLGLRSATFLADAITQAGLQVIGRRETRPRHAKASDSSDPLHYARSAEVTSLWRLGLAS